MELFQPTYCWWKKSCTTWDNLPINWCRILSINSITVFWAHLSWLWSNLDQLRQDGLLDLTELHTGRLLGSLARSSSWWQLAPWKYSITLVGSRWAWPNKTKLWGPGFYEPSSCKGYNSPGKKTDVFSATLKDSTIYNWCRPCCWKHEFCFFLGRYRLLPAGVRFFC